MKLKPIKKRIEYGGAIISNKEKKAINKVINSQGGRRWTLGPESVAFEKELAAKAGVRGAVVTNSGSSALLVAIAALKLPEGSKVIIPALTFPTAYSSLLQARLIPVVIDCDIDTLNLSFNEVKKALKQHPDIMAVVAIHIAGNIVDLKKLRKIVGNRIIISDNCDGFSGTLDGKYIDNYADVSCVSFHAAHIITTGEGGAVLSNDEGILTRARKIREWGRASGSDTITTLEGFPDDYRERYVFEEIGYNVKPLEVQCAMGRVQLKRLDGFKKKRISNFNELKETFDQYKEFKTLDYNDENCWFGFPFICKGIERKKVMDFFESLNIETRTIFSGNILKHPAYAHTEHITISELKNCETVMRKGMFITNHPSLTRSQMNFIKKAVKELHEQSQLS